MQTFLFLFESFQFVSWLFVLGCVFAGTAFAHSMWAYKETQILQLRREQSRLRQEIALREKALAAKPVNRNLTVAQEAASFPRAVPSERRAAVQSQEDQRIRSTRPAMPEVSLPDLSATRGSRRNSLREDKQLGLVFYVAPEEPDPLNRLPSITDAQVKDLNMLGVYKFEQIARWNETNERSFALLLGMDPAQLGELDWVRQAKTLHGMTHGSKMVLAS